MKNPSYLPLLLVAIGLAVHADESPVDVGERIHVDVGEVVATGEAVPVDGITSSGQPDEAALRVFANAGYVAIIDMRGPDEDRGLDDERAVVQALGLDYVPFPITGRDEINFDTAKELDGLLRGIDGPVLLHCGSGNRVGAMLALRQSLHGADDDAAIAYGKDAGLTRLEPLVRERLDDK
ncbi:MAG: sulfur transferase domain-containing protein [Gammaproteobacteria bacterium]|nr:sulfur transferase domain-containing protein [Gammaproteobacteria bacterium]MDH3751633.1 sulfur transferase domain-containing protein [Gammaproteobacteria bacterium]MDH3806889.1 sulfur transferase domain-containing protein [Gammaproteobacteria bacterium]